MSTHPDHSLVYTGCSARRGTDYKDLRAPLAQLRNETEKNDRQS